MYLKEYIISNISIISLINKSIGKARYISFLIINVFMPILLTFLYITNENSFQNKALLFMQVVFPFTAVLNIIFSTRNFLEMDGNEFFYCKSNKDIFVPHLIMFLCKIINIFIFIIVLQAFTQSFNYESVRIICACIFLFGLDNLASVIFKSTSITLLINLLYVFFNILFKNEIPKMFFYLSIDLIPKQYVLCVTIPLLSMGLIMTLLSIILKKCFMFK